MTLCLNCPTDASGADTNGMCQSCKAGLYQEQVTERACSKPSASTSLGSSVWSKVNFTCQSCLPGTMSASAALKCTVCDPGFFSAEMNATSCLACQQGFFSGLTASSW